MDSVEGGFIAASVSDYPELTAVAILVVGVGAAAILRALVQQGLEALDRQLARAATTSEGVVTPALIRVAKGVTFWAVTLVAVTLALRLFGDNDLSLGLNAAVAFVPRLLAGLVIIGAGHLLALLARGLVVRLADDLHDHSPVPRLVYWSIMLIAIVMGLQQMQIDITFATQLILVLVGVVGAGLMLAFALGSRAQVANIMAQSSVRRFSVGERIRIDEVEGTIVEIHTTGVELSTGTGTASIPAARFAEGLVLRLAPTGSGDD